MLAVVLRSIWQSSPVEKAVLSEVLSQVLLLPPPFPRTFTWQTSPPLLLRSIWQSPPVKAALSSEMLSHVLLLVRPPPPNRPP